MERREQCATEAEAYLNEAIRASVAAHRDVRDNGTMGVAAYGHIRRARAVLDLAEKRLQEASDLIPFVEETLP